MSKTQGRTGKRRRWLMAAVAVFVIAAMAWWYWPGGDARFVGKWTRFVSTGQGGFFELGPQELWSNGRGRLTSGPASSPVVSFFNWHVEGDEFVFGNGGGPGAFSFTDRWQPLLVRHFGFSFVTSGCRYRIVKVHPHSIMLVNEESGSTDVLNRLLE